LLRRGRIGSSLGYFCLFILSSSSADIKGINSASCSKLLENSIKSSKKLFMHFFVSHRQSVRRYVVRIYLLWRAPTFKRYAKGRYLLFCLIFCQLCNEESPNRHSKAAHFFATSYYLLLLQPYQNQSFGPSPKRMRKYVFQEILHQKCSP